MSGILHARYRMLADLYPQISTRDRSGQVVRDWDYDNPIDTIRCSARGILGAGIRVVGSTQTFGVDYDDVEWVKMRVGETNLFSDEYLVKSYRVGNIRNYRTEYTLWRGPEGNPLVFNIFGISPVFDPFDRVVEYDVLLKGVTGD